MADHKINGVLDARDNISRYGLSSSLAKEEKYDFYEELLQPSQLEDFLGHKKAKDMYVRDYDYHGRYDCYYQNEDDYKTLPLCSFPMKYLGVPLISTRLSHCDCQPLFDKIKAQMA